MVLYRFELRFFDELQDVGFLQGLEDIGLDVTTERLLLEQFDALPCPDCDEAVSFWFTETGLLTFASAIRAIEDSIEPLGWSLTAAEYQADEEDMEVAVYSDNFQVALPQEWVKNLMPKYGALPALLIKKEE